jgi:hypothetical protein
MDAILKNRAQGHRDSTYAMLLQLVAANETPACLRSLEQMVATPRVGCWRDVRGFLCHFERHGYAHAHAVALVQGCVRMTNAQIRTDHAARRQSWAAKWVPREPKCRRSPVLQWYYAALAADMFPGAPDAKRRYRKLISALSPSPASPASPSLAWFVKQSDRVPADPADPCAQTINALWRQHVARCKPLFPPGLIPVLSLAHSMGPGHNNCLHAGIGLALHLHHLHHLHHAPNLHHLHHLHHAPNLHHLLTFSAHANWHALEGGDFVSHAQELLRAARSPTNGLNANLTAAVAAVAASGANKTLLVISDMEHDEWINATAPAPIMTWNVSRNGRPASFCGDNCHAIAITQ